jgi:chromosome partitioning protein
MRTIAFVTQKGGSGKSTLAVSLAVAAREAGERVFLIDMDPQRSLGRWAEAREEGDLPVEFIAPAKLPRALAELEKNRIGLVIIDTPATDSSAAEAAMKAADLCVIPSRPTVFDLWSSDVTRSRIKALGKEYVFVLNQCPAMPDSTRVQDGMKALEAMGGLITPLIVARADFQEAARYGLGPTEYAPSGKAADETRMLWGSLKRRLSKIKSAAASKEPAKAAAPVKATAPAPAKAPAPSAAKPAARKAAA